MPNLLKEFAEYYRHMAVTVLIIVVVTITILVRASRVDIGIHWFVFVAGTVGGVANNYRRLQRAGDAIKEVEGSLTSRLLTIQLYVSPLIGGIFAVILYGLFLGGILQGGLFPDFTQLEKQPYEGVSHFIKAATPTMVMDAAKLLVWSFVAGFSEAFVPNIIDKLAHEAKNNS